MNEEQLIRLEAVRLALQAHEQGAVKGDLVAAAGEIAAFIRGEVSK